MGHLLNVDHFVNEDHFVNMNCFVNMGHFVTHTSSACALHLKLAKFSAAQITISNFINFLSTLAYENLCIYITFI